jgi:adenylate cyclase
MVKWIIVILIAGFCNPTSAQPIQKTSIDSLYMIWQDESKSDTIRLNAINKFIWRNIIYSQPDSAFHLAQQMIHLSRDEQNLRWEGRALFIQGITAYLKGNYPQALEYLKACLIIYEEVRYPKGIAGALHNIGLIYFNMGDHPRALDYYTKGLKIQKELGDDRAIASGLNNIGLLYYLQYDYPKALEYFTESLVFSTKVNNRKGNAACYANIGNIYNDEGEYSKALEYYLMALEIREEIDDQTGIANSYSSIGVIHFRQGDYTKALDHYSRSLAISEKNGDRREAADVLSRIGNNYMYMENYQMALVYCQNAYDLAKEIGALRTQKNSSEYLYLIYKNMDQGSKALEFHELFNSLEDSLNAKETATKLQQMEFQKQVLADSIAQVEKDRLLEEVHQDEVRKKNIARNYFAGAGFLFLLLAGGFYSRWRYVRKSKAVLQVEKNKSENLLLNILPEEIAEELKEKGRADARDFDMVTIIFTDFKGFTSLSEQLTAQELVAEINTCFEAFDRIMGELGIEKIKTIGDAYMAAGGLPVPSEDSVKNCVLAGLKMQEFIAQRKIELDALGKPAFQMRVGIHTGPVVAGIVGVKKFQYDIWGDTVNTASRMESSGAVGKVNISQSTYELLKDLPASEAGDSGFTFETRGKVEAKGKGEMDMWFVTTKPATE